MQCPVLVRAFYAMSSTDLRYGAMAGRAGPAYMGNQGQANWVALELRVDRVFQTLARYPPYSR
eukprot:259586-Rhodomonas_salina.2